MAFQFGDHVLDPATRELRAGSIAISIEPKVFDVLHVLITHRDRVVTKDELIDLVWDGRFISESSVSTAIKAARQAVGDDGKQQAVIRTIHGHGFRFVADLIGEVAPVLQPPVAVSESGHPTNLKRRRRPLIGRVAEAEAVLARLSPGALVSIVGPGGAGKTALAAHVASLAMQNFPGGVWVCELAPVEGAQIYSTILGALDSSAGAGPVNAAFVAERFRPEPVLLILDNCEHILDAVVPVVEALAEVAPHLAILTTSREALEIPEERVLRISGLPFEGVESLAVALFRHCADQVADFVPSAQNLETFQQITARLEGLPLAIELAAPRLASNTPQELLAALDDQLSVLATRRRRGDARHSAMDDAIAWSFDLLDPEEQQTLLSLSTFAGAFTAQSAEAICETAQPRTLLHNLVGQSMVAFVPGAPTSRFRLLEPIRQFAQRQLDPPRRAQLEERHARWFAERVQDLAQQMRGPEEIDACVALTAEWSDVGRALAWGRLQALPEIAVEPLLALNIHLLWQLRMEGFQWLEAGIDTCDLPEDRIAYARLVQAMGAWSAGDLDRSEALMEACIAQGGETIETAYFQFYQGFAREDFDKVFASGEKAWRWAQATEDTAWKITTTAFHVCGCAMHKGNAPEIPALFDSLSELQAGLDWPSGRCCELIGRTVAAFGRGDPAAVENHRTALQHAADHCFAPWFKVTAAGIEARKSRTQDEAWSELAFYAQNLKSAIKSGDMIQLPTITRAVAICLYDVGALEFVAQLSGLIPSIRGLGEKGSLAPGYDDVVSGAQADLGEDAFQNLATQGAAWTLDDLTAALDQVTQNSPQRV